MSLNIKNLNVSINNKNILNDFNININDGEIHAIMGPNGVGKSTLTKVIMGDKNYNIKSGDIIYNETSILNHKTDERSKLGIFVCMQTPPSIDGVCNQDVLRTAMNAHQNKYIGLYDFMMKCEKSINELKMDKEMIHRSFNVGFSGGEKKKNEVLQIKLLKPNLIILDELDSGLDVDSLITVCENIKNYIKDNKQTSLLIITHYPRILEYLKPDYVHILTSGKISKTGSYNLALEIEKNGYKIVTNDINGSFNNE